VDGCKLPSNASKEWSGTKSDFKKKALKLEKAIERIIKKHQEIDHIEEINNIIQADTKYIATLQKQIKKIRDWVKDNDDKPGASGKPIKSIQAPLSLERFNAVMVSAMQKKKILGVTSRYILLGKQKNNTYSTSLIKGRE